MPAAFIAKMNDAVIPHRISKTTYLELTAPVGLAPSRNLLTSGYCVFNSFGRSYFLVMDPIIKVFSLFFSKARSSSRTLSFRVSS